jgi:hypothetical protein
MGGAERRRHGGLSDLGRGWLAATAAVVIAGLVIQLDATADSTGGFFQDRTDRVLNVFAFFTIQSNLLLGITCLIAAIRPRTRSTVFRVARLCGVIGIAITGVVFHFALRDLQDLTGQAKVADFLLHTASPILGVSGWLLFGPRRLTSKPVVWWTLAFPVTYGVFTLIRGEAVGWYPYPFMDVAEHGYPRIVVNCAIIGAAFVAFATGAHALDRRLPGRR